MRRYNASTYVSATPEQVEFDPVMEHALTQTLERDVLVPAFQNVAGGLGIFVVAMVWMFVRIDGGSSTLITQEVLVRSGYWGAGVFGLACLVRSFADEVQIIFYHISRGWAEGQAAERIQELENENDSLQQEIRQLSQANVQMVRGVKLTTGRDELPQAPPRVSQDEYTEPLRDALALCRYQETHSKISRDAVTAAGIMDRQRWEVAKRLLIDSGVIVENGIIGASPAIAMSKVREFVSKQRNLPGDFVAPFEQ